MTNQGLIGVTNQGLNGVTNQGLIGVTNQGLNGVTDQGLISVTDQGLIRVTDQGLIRVTDQGLNGSSDIIIFRKYNFFWINTWKFRIFKVIQAIQRPVLENGFVKAAYRDQGQIF